MVFNKLKVLKNFVSNNVLESLFSTKILNHVKEERLNKYVLPKSVNISALFIIFCNYTFI